MPTVTIEERGCRGCTMCADICPTQVFDLAGETAVVARTEDCIGCLSCTYACPSQCVEVSDTHVQRPFYRLEENVALVERFLQAKSASATLTDDDWQEASRDVASTLVALSGAIVEMLGRGSRALGRKSGALAAAHLPELYEEPTLEGLMERLQARFRHCFDFEYRLDGEAVDLTFAPCALARIVQDAGETVGDAMLCQLFHGYLAGLLGAHRADNSNYVFELGSAGETCALRLAPK